MYNSNIYECIHHCQIQQLNYELVDNFVPNLLSILWLGSWLTGKTSCAWEWQSLIYLCSLTPRRCALHTMSIVHSTLLTWTTKLCMQISPDTALCWVLRAFNITYMEKLVKHQRALHVNSTRKGKLICGRNFHTNKIKQVVDDLVVKEQMEYFCMNIFISMMN